MILLPLDTQKAERRDVSKGKHDCELLKHTF